MNARYVWSAQSVDFARRIDLLAFVPDGDMGGIKALALPVKFTFTPPAHPDAFIEEPTLQMGYKEAQSLLDALLRAGIKPSMPADESRLVEALKYHLEDMRGLALQNLNQPTPFELMRKP